MSYSGTLPRNDTSTTWRVALRATVSESWARAWPLIVILLVAIVGWLLLASFAHHVRVQDPAQAKGWSADDYKNAKTWATDVLGLATSIAGFLGISAAGSKQLEAVQRAQCTEGGTVGILAGVTLLGVGGWLAPLGLAAMATGFGAGHVVRALRR